MKIQYIGIVESEVDFDFLPETTVEQRAEATSRISEDSRVVVCYGKMNAETFEKEWNKGTELVNRDMELKADFAAMFKPILESMIRQGVIITNPDGTYSQRPHSKALFINLIKDMIMHFYRNYLVEEEQENMLYLSAKKEVKNRNITQDKKDELQEVIDNHTPSIFSGMEGMMIKKGLEMAIDKLPNLLKKGEPEPDIRLDPVEFLECFDVCNAFTQKWVAEMMSNNTEIQQMFKSLNIPFPKANAAKILKINGE